MSTQKIGLSGIDSSEILMGSKKKQENLENKKIEIFNLLEKNKMPQRHSYFQLRYFVIGKEPTNQSKMWQCLREIRARTSSLEGIELEYEEQKDALELLEIEEKTLEINKKSTKNTESIANITELDNLKQKENEIKIRKIKRKKKSIISNMVELLNKKKYIEEELNFFLEMFKAIERVEPLRSLDDVEAQKNYWSEKLTQKLNLKLLSGGSIDNELIETIVALPDDMTIKKQVINTLTLRQEQIVKKIEENKGKLNGN